MIKNGAIYKLIQKELSRLPGEAAHVEMIPFRLKSSLALDKDKHSSPKSSAVLCLLSPTDHDINIILMERQQDGGAHSGQISFPGGKREPNDRDLMDTALRETEEEIGLNRNGIEVLGKLTDVYIPVSNFLVAPYLAWTQNVSNLVLSDREVKSVFQIKVSELIDPQFKTTKDIPNHQGHILKNIPCFFINQKVIWGATSLMLNELKHILMRIKAESGQNQML